MDLQALDASLTLTNSRLQRGEAGNETGRQFTAELNQALAQRREDGAPKPDTPARSEDKTASANERPEPPPRRSEASEPCSRRQADAAARATARQERRDQDRIHAGEARQAAEPRDDETSDVESAAAPGVATAETAEVPPSKPTPSSDVKATDGQTDPSITAVVVAPTAPTIPVPPAPTSLVAADVAAAVAADATAPAAAVAPGEATPAASIPADEGTLPLVGIPLPTEIAAASGIPADAAASASIPEPVVATASTAPAQAALPSQPVPAQAPSPQAAVTPATTDDAAAATPAPGMPASTAPTSTTPAPTTDTIVAITFAAEMPPKPIVPAPLALQAIEEPVLPAAPVEAAPAAAAPVTASAIPPTAQTASNTSQTEAQTSAPVVAPTAAPAEASSFADAIETAEAPVEAATAEQPARETTQLTQNVADRRTAIDQTVRAEQTQATRQNLPLPQPVADQLAIRIARQAQGGEGRISLQLRPETLGIVDVDIEVRKDGSMKAVLSVEKPETLEWLKRDAQHLERALQDVGVKTDSGSLNFALREQRQDGSGGFARSGARRGPDLGGGTEPAGRMAEARLAEVAARRMARGGVDVRI